jgi:hypothetical protein
MANRIHLSLVSQNHHETQNIQTWPVALTITFSEFFEVYNMLHFSQDLHSYILIVSIGMI